MASYPATAGRRLVPQLAKLEDQNDEELFGPLGKGGSCIAVLDEETGPGSWPRDLTTNKENPLNKQVIHEVALATQRGKMTFPQVVEGLLEAGVESYLVDFATGQKTHFLSDGTTLCVPMILDPGPISAVFSSADVVAAIRGAQADTVRYPEFVKRSTAAGVIGYWAFLTGKRVIYFGRKGEQHIEEFPKPQMEKIST
jgi:uncharacterized protein YbcV (DUF1398 family)